MFKNLPSFARYLLITLLVLFSIFIVFSVSVRFLEFPFSVASVEQQFLTSPIGQLILSENPISRTSKDASENLGTPDPITTSPFSNMENVPEVPEMTSSEYPCTSSLEVPIPSDHAVPVENVKVTNTEGTDVFSFAKETDVDLANFRSWWVPFHFYNENEGILILSGYVSKIDLQNHEFVLPINNLNYTVTFSSATEYWVSNIVSNDLIGISDIYPLAQDYIGVMEKLSTGSSLTVIGFVDSDITEFIANVIYIIHYD